MSTSPESAHTALKLQEARELMAQGQPEKALAVALSALQQAMLHLRDALARLQQNLAHLNAKLPRQEISADQPSREAVPRIPKPRFYH